MNGRWVGRALVAIGLIHSGLGVVAFSDTWTTLLAEGLWNTVNLQPDREAHFWFVTFGVVVVFLGLTVRHLEREGWPLPHRFGWWLTLLVVPAVVIMPISGWWALFIPAGLALARREGEPARA